MVKQDKRKLKSITISGFKSFDSDEHTVNERDPVSKSGIFKKSNY